MRAAGSYNDEVVAQYANFALAKLRAAQQPGGRQKKGTSKVETRLPTKRMATACWAFIVAKSPPLQAAYLLGSRPLQGANSDFHPQLINSALCIPWGQFQSPPARQSTH
jgi:hypothetical protein